MPVIANNYTFMFRNFILKIILPKYIIIRDDQYKCTKITTFKMKKIKSIILLFVICFSINAHAFQNNDSWIGENFSGFKKINLASGKKFAVSSADERASKAAAEILEKGGNAIDAAITAQLVLNVTEPHSSGIGGGGFLLYFDAKTAQSKFFNGRETAPEKSFSTMFLDKNGKAREFQDIVRGGLSVGTPGLLKILKETHDKYGKLPWADLFLPAIKLAQDGFAVNERIHTLSKQVSYLKDFDETAEIYLKKDGSIHEVGDIITNKKMAKTLEDIAQNGIDVFYNGKIANDIVKAVNNSKINPGYLSVADLKNYKSKTGELICGAYRTKYKVCSMPLPSSGGVTLLQILGILENFDLSKMRANSKEALHLITEATRLAYADRNEYVADSADVPIKKMLDKKYLQKRSQLIKPNAAMKNIEAGKFEGSEEFHTQKMAKNDNAEFPSTTHISIIDADGNAVCLTSSIEYFFGSALSVDGFMLNNQLTDFSLTPTINNKPVANRLEPNKQPRSSMTPTFVFDENNQLIMIAGSPGGPRIIQFTLKTILNYLDFKMDIQKAISSPNFIILNDVIELENNTAITKLKPKLEKLGHQVKLVDIVSGINAITIEGKKIKAGADPRRQGFAIAR